jgi:hypothetical protein
MEGHKILCDLLALTGYSTSVGSEGRTVELFGVDLVSYFGAPT